MSGRGPGRMHWYRGIRSDYFKQIASEVKAPMKGRPRNRLYWQPKAGVRNECLDIEVYNLHAARKLKINLMTEVQWLALEERLRQPDLVGAVVAAPTDASTSGERAVPAESAPANKSNKAGAESPRPADAPRPRTTNPLLAQLTPVTGPGPAAGGMDRPY